jgi:hypothetical protein
MADEVKVFQEGFGQIPEQEPQGSRDQCREADCG